MIASVKQKVDGESADKADSVKKIPIAEKRYRLGQQERRLGGISITGELEPSHQLLDLANNVLETGAGDLDRTKSVHEEDRRSAVGREGTTISHTGRKSSAQSVAIVG